MRSIDLKTFFLLLLSVFELNKCSAQIEKEMSKPVIVFIGASETSGYGLPKNSSYADKFSKHLLENQLSFEILNHSFPGAATGDGEEMLNHVFEKTENIHSIFISLGLSDVIYGINSEEIYLNYQKMIKVIISKSADIKIHIMEGEIFQYHALPDLPSHDSAYYKAYKSIYKRLEDNEPVVVFPFLMKNFIEDSKYFLQDMVHPNEKGISVMAYYLYTLFIQD